MLDRGQVRLRSRTGKPITWLPELTTLGQALPHRRLILDGELVALVDGRPSIAALQQRMRLRRPTATSAPALMAVFDLLYLDEDLLIGRAYQQRRALLEHLALPAGAFQVVPAVAGAGEAMLAAVFQQDLEGVLAKRLDSPYQPRVRSHAWRKILARRRLPLLIGGFIPTAAGVGGLLVGEPDPPRKRAAAVPGEDRPWVHPTHPDAPGRDPDPADDRPQPICRPGWLGYWGGARGDDHRGGSARSSRWPWTTSAATPPAVSSATQRLPESWSDAHPDPTLLPCAGLLRPDRVRPSRSGGKRSGRGLTGHPSVPTLSRV